MKQLVIASFIFYVHLTSYTSYSQVDKELYEQCLLNGQLNQESSARSFDFLEAWLRHRDPETGLIPTNLLGELGQDVWEPHNSAADNYSFMALTSLLFDDEASQRDVLDMLRNERLITSRINSLPDTYQFSKGDFLRNDMDTSWVIFGTSEYIKDGLLPILELIGDSKWSDRMMEMLLDMEAIYPHLKNNPKVGAYKAPLEEVNGEMLQTLSRLYWKTGNPTFFKWAIEIGDYYLTSQEENLAESEYLRLRDHGCEIIGGLSELYVLVSYIDPYKKEQYKPGMYRLLDRILEVGTNKDHLFYNEINAKTGAVLDSGIVDNWEYIFNAYYAIYLVDGYKPYKEAIVKAFQNLNNNYRNYAWEGTSHDGYADAIESGINIYNRERIPSLKEWIDSEIHVMWSMQQSDGLIGKWHGDGNFARTALMYALWKSQGAYLQPWNRNLSIGGETLGDDLYLTVSSDKKWKGLLRFDPPRHQTILNMPIDYPRINQFPEWYTISPDKNYLISTADNALNMIMDGNRLINGIPIELMAGKTLKIKVTAHQE